MQPILDVEVAGTRCYEVAGAIHHNTGKTWAGAMEIAYHLTGAYPDWWPGRRFQHPVRVWASGVTNESTRDNPQRLLVGEPAVPDQWGTGTIPRKRLVSYRRATSSVANLLDSLVVEHVSGGHSYLGFKSYEKGREKWQGETLHVIWFDEEPPMDIYMEGLTRTNATGGMVFLTFTPLLGMSEVVRMFLTEEAAEIMKGAK